jgi:tetratricopeptide (TPR) repeat protein
LIETGGREERAESLLVTATKWARFADTGSLDKGTTYELLARLKMESGDYDAAVENAKTAIALMDDEASAGARRVLAQSLRRAGRYDAAAQAYIELIALERGTIHEDINALQLFIGRTNSYRAEYLSATLDSAIAEREEEKRRQAAAEGAELVTVRARDGLELEGTLRRRDGEGAVLFIPDLGKSRRVFTPYAQLLGVDGISSLTLDLRGQGGSRYDSLLSQEDLPLSHAQELPEDVVAGFRYLQQAMQPASDRIVIVTEGFASPVVERALPRDGLAAPVVHLSPAFDPLDKELANSIAFHPDFPVLIYYSTEDLNALRSSSFFRNVKKFSKLDIRPLEKSGRGVDMLKRNPNALEGFQNWVRSATASP